VQRDVEDVALPLEVGGKASEREVLLQEQDRSAESGEPVRRRQSAEAGTDDDDVVPFLQVVQCACDRSALL
jgi:hypothetical protein